MTQATSLHRESTHLDAQAHVGITKHIGGFEAADALLALCRLTEVLERIGVDREVSRNLSD